MTILNASMRIMRSHIVPDACSVLYNWQRGISTPSSAGPHPAILCSPRWNRCQLRLTDILALNMKATSRRTFAGVSQVFLINVIRHPFLIGLAVSSICGIRF